MGSRTSLPKVTLPITYNDVAFQSRVIRWWHGGVGIRTVRPAATDVFRKPGFAKAVADVIQEIKGELDALSDS